MKIHELITDDSITLYWEREEGMKEHFSYEFEGKKGTLKSTHLMLDALAPDSVYTLKLEGKEYSFKTLKKKKRVDITKAPYSVKGDGLTLQTKIIQKAIDDIKESEILYFPPGVYLTGALNLHSDMELYLEEGAVLRGSKEEEDYLPKRKSRFEGHEMECFSSLLNLGELDHNAPPNARNVIIRGKGTIEGGGRELAFKIIENERVRLKAYISSLGDKVKECENENTIPGRVRPRLINLSNAENVRISGLKLKNGPSWNVHMIYSKNIVTDHCTFSSEDVWNGDGWDPDSSEDCTLFASSFYTGDDSVAIKSGKNPEGNIIARATKRIRVFDCHSAYGHGIVIGSEISGGVEDVYIYDSDLSSSMYGLEVKGTRKRGGYVKNIRVENCTLPRILIHSVKYNDDGEAAPTIPVFEDFTYKNITLLGHYLDIDNDKMTKSCPVIEVEGFQDEGHELKNINFTNITIPENSEIRISKAESINFNGIKTKER